MDAAEYATLMEVLSGEPEEWTQLDESTMRLRLQQVRELQGNPELDDDTLIKLEMFDDIVASRLEDGPPHQTTRPAPDYVGLSEAAAGQLAADRGVSFRVVERDGERFFITLEGMYGRISATITGGVVADAREEYDHVAETLVRLVDLEVFAAAVEDRRPGWEARGCSVEYQRGHNPSVPAARVILETGKARGLLHVRVSGDAIIELARTDGSDPWRTQSDAVTSADISHLLDDLTARVLA